MCSIQAKASEVNFTCRIHVLHIWSQLEEEEDEEDLELMRIYHSGSTMRRRVEYTWPLRQCAESAPANVRKGQTMWYSPLFDGRTWCLILVERADEFMLALQLLALPFGIGALALRFQFTVRRRSSGRTLVHGDVEHLKYGEAGDEGGLVAESRAWRKAELFGADWRTHFALADVAVTVRAEVLHVQGLNEEHILRINWPLFGVESAAPEHFDDTDFVVTSDEFGGEHFGFNYMVGRLRNELGRLREEVALLREGASRGRRGGDVRGGGAVEAGARLVRLWLQRVGMAQYWTLLSEEGFDSMEMVKQINDRADLEYVGVHKKAHQMKLMNAINLLKRDE